MVTLAPSPVSYPNPASPSETLDESMGVHFVYDLRARRTVYLHDGCALMRGYTVDAVKHLQTDLFALVPDDERAHVHEAVTRWETTRTGQKEAFAFRIELPRRGQGWISGRLSIPEQPNGTARLAVGYLHLTK